MNSGFDGARHVRVGNPDILWNWVLTRQGLAKEKMPDSALAVSILTLGLHAARLPSPYTTAAVRVGLHVSLHDLLGPQSHGHLITIRCMRKTLHTLPTAIASLAHGATVKYRLRDVLSIARREGFPEAELSALAEDALAFVGEYGMVGHREIEFALGALGATPMKSRLALKYLWERGTLSYRNVSATWHRETRRFGLAAETHPQFDPCAAEGESVGRLMREYFHRYGPATIKDASWWSGLGQALIATSLQSEKLVLMTNHWAASPMYMLTEDYEMFRRANKQTCMSGTQLLAHEDVALKAYHESRARYLGELPAEAAFNQIGEVRPTILQNGRIRGLWSWDHKRDEISIRHLRGTTSRAERRETCRIAGELGAKLRQGLDSQSGSLALQTLITGDPGVNEGHLARQ